VANDVLAGVITSQDGSRRTDNTPFGRNYRVVHAADLIPTFPRMASRFVHPGPVYNIATALNIFTVEGLTKDNFRTFLPPRLPTVLLGDVTRNDGPDTELLLGLPLAGTPAADQAGFDHIFYFNLTTNCADPLAEAPLGPPLF
jgi:hypothetical protein